MATAITQTQVTVLAGASRFAALPEADASLIAGIVEKRLLTALCMTEAPAAGSDDYDLWLALLASAIVTFDSIATDDGIVSESMRNYSYTLRGDANTWADLKAKSGDLLAYFSKCGGGVDMQVDVTRWQYGAYGVPMDWPVGGAL